MAPLFCVPGRRLPESPGASVVGEALKTDSMLEGLRMSGAYWDPGTVWFCAAAWVQSRPACFRCSSSHISAVGAQSPGQSLRANQTLRILAVSVAPAQTCLCLSVQTPPLHIPSPRRQLGTQVPEPR
ncbi:hypothetical protein MC885_019610 [Smutsia gigantea]|nr:hypothetical protein MC885_019610 [Smutsia gigantea]